MGLSLTSKTPGAPDNAYLWYMHSSGGTLAAGFTITLGDGTDTPLFINSDGFGPRNSGGKTTIIKTAATDLRTVTFADRSGEIHPSIVSAVTPGQTETAGTSTAVAGLSLALQAGKKYQVRAVLVLKTTNTGNGFRAALNGPGGWEGGFSALYGMATEVFASLGTTVSNGNSPVANTPFPVIFTGYIDTASGGAGNLTANFWAETAGQTLTLVAARIEAHELN